MNYLNADELPTAVIRQAADWMWDDASLEHRQSYLKAAARAHLGNDGSDTGLVAVPIGDLRELLASIKGDAYKGEEWEIKCIEALMTGAKADRKDAERYQWLREQGALADSSRHPHSWRCIRMLSDMGGEHADDAIDAAMAKQGEK